VERLRDIFSHPHELIVRGGQRRASCHKVANGLCGVAEAERERCLEDRNKVDVALIGVGFDSKHQEIREKGGGRAVLVRRQR